MRHVLRSQQFDRPTLTDLFVRADELRHWVNNRHLRRALSELHADRIVYTIFYEPSTRTRISFAAAATHLGMKVVTTENAREFSSAAKGETLEDTIRVLCEYDPDVIVLRHHEEGAAERAAAVSSVPIINAGDGPGQHPTQALLDLYTIQRELGRLDDLNVVIGGDLAHGRTARSLAYLLAMYSGIRMTFVAPRGLEMGEDIKAYLSKKGVPYEETNDLHAALSEADVVYWLRVQKERLEEYIHYEDVAHKFVIGEDELRVMKSPAVLMHPLPRVTEIAVEVDSDPRAAYFRQAGNGLYLRMALFEWVLDDA